MKNCSKITDFNYLEPGPYFSIADFIEASDIDYHSHSRKT